MKRVVNLICQYFPLFASISQYFPVNATGMANMLICRHVANLAIRPIEEFPIIGFYLYHLTSAGQSSNWTTSGIKQHILTDDLFL